MSTLLSVAVCLSPLLIFWLGYLAGRYGLPIVIRRRQLRDRRAGADSSDSSPDVEIFRAGGGQQL